MLLQEKALRENIEILSNIHNIDEESIIKIMEDFVFPRTIRQQFNKDTNIKTIINRDNFKVSIFRAFEVNDDEETFNPHNQIKSNDVKNYTQDGDYYFEQIDSDTINIDKRNSAITAKQVLISEINKFKKRKVRDESLKFKNDLISVVVKSYDLKKKVYFVEFKGEFTGIIPFSNLINENEKLKVGERYQALMTEEEDVRFQDQVIFTRKGSDFVRALFAKEVPEIQDEIINIKNIFMTQDKKIFLSVHSSDKNIDPVGVCVGVKGSRINNIITQLNGGSIDIFKWEPEASDYILSIFKGLGIFKINVLENSIVIFIKEEEFQTLNQQNKLRLKAINSFLTEKVYITTEERYTKENEGYINYFMDELDIDREIAEIIANSGFYKSIDDLTMYSNEDNSDILGLDEDITEEISSRASNKMAARNLEIISLDTNLKELKNLQKHHLKMLLDNNIDNILDLADLCNDELCDLILIDINEANDLIMEAREIAY